MEGTDVTSAAISPRNERINIFSSLPFFLLQASSLFVLVTGTHLRDVVVCFGLYFFRMWAVTTGYHRYFSHRTFKTSRAFQFVLAVLGSLCLQKGCLWWAAHHRHHHRESDQAADVHSPIQRGFWWSHMGWILCDKYVATRFESIKDFARFPELRFLNTFYWIPPVLMAAGLYAWGGASMLVWGFAVSTTLLWHGTFTINSLSHVFGKRRYKTTDTSRNNWLLALITMGEGWHNNHHYHQNTANQGWFWWEVDVSFYVLRLLQALGIVWDVKTPPDAVKYAYKSYTDADRAVLADEGGFWGSKRLNAARAKVREALNAAADSLPRGAPAPAPLLKRQ
jgi:stearoyl-CoA desaturase (delta-9 desaturase)